jgi:hypothetical protein
MKQKQIEKLISVGKKYDCDFYLPPFIRGSTNPFFDITKIVKDKEKVISFRDDLIKHAKMYTVVQEENKTYIELHK